MRRTSSATQEFPQVILVILIYFHFLFMRKPTHESPLWVRSVPHGCILWSAMRVCRQTLSMFRRTVFAITVSCNRRHLDVRSGRNV